LRGRRKDSLIKATVRVEGLPRAVHASAAEYDRIKVGLFGGSPLIFSPDSQHFAFTAKKGEKWF
jgi:hypothetical protein